MSARLFTSDQHFGHELVARLRGYSSVEEHDEAIMAAWKRAVRKRDTVYVLGDISGGRQGHALEILESLPGTKHLIAGNHDSAHPMSAKGAASQRRFLEVFDSVLLFGVVKLYGQRVLMSHIPYTRAERDAAREERYDQWRPRDIGARLLCGHVHDAWRINGSQFNVGVDHSLEPVHEKNLKEWLNAPLVSDVREDLIQSMGPGSMSRGQAQARVRAFCVQEGPELDWLSELAGSMNLLTRDMVDPHQVADQLQELQDRSWS